MNRPAKRTPIKSKAGRQTDIVKLRFMLGLKLTAFNHFVASRLGLSVTDLKCLEVAYHDEMQPITPGRLARLIGLSPASVTVSLKRLEKGGLIRREIDPTDRRRILLRFVPARVALLNACYQVINERLDSFDAALAEDEFECVRKYLSGLLDILDSGMLEDAGKAEEADDDRQGSRTHRPRRGDAERRL